MGDRHSSASCLISNNFHSLARRRWLIFDSSLCFWRQAPHTHNFSNRFFNHYEKCCKRANITHLLTAIVNTIVLCQVLWSFVLLSDNLATTITMNTIQRSFSTLYSYFEVTASKHLCILGDAISYDNGSSFCCHCMCMPMYANLFALLLETLYCPFSEFNCVIFLTG
jgi:hypothetical protein